MSVVKSLSVGDGDMFYIDHNSDNFSIIDCCVDESNRKGIVAEIMSKAKEKGITRFISTHPDDDHILGLKYLNEKMELLNFYCVKNEATRIIFLAELTFLLIALIIPNVGMGENGHTKAHCAGSVENKILV